MTSHESDPLHQDERRHDETRHHFDETIDEIKDGVVELGGLVEDNLRRAGVAAVEGQLDLIPSVVAADEEIDLRYTELERLTFMTIARQQPVAIDLRFLVSATRLLYELERSGDLVVKIANALERINGIPNSPALRSLLERLFEESGAMLSRSMEVFGAMDAEAGMALDDEDDVVDDLVADFYREIGSEGENVGLEVGIALTRMGRFLERIADHAVNVGEHTAYIVTATFPGHTHEGLATDV
jgi:phosphate transport system protein